MPSKKSTTEVVGMPWGFAAIWEEMFRCIPERPMVARNYMYASELSGSYLERYLKMHAHKPSNPFDWRARTKMMAGKFFESVVKLILVGTGILRGEQIRSEITLPKCLRVSGKIDFIAGGVIDWKEAHQRAEAMQKLFQYCFDDLYPFIKHMTDKILVRFENLFGKTPLEEMIIEVKSVSGFVFELVQKNGPRQGHPLQSLHYLLGNKHIKKAMILYISRESCEIHEVYIERTPELLKQYREDVATMTMYYNKSIGKDYKKHLPPKDEEVIFEPATFKFAKNNLVEYSKYLTMNYGYKDLDEYKAKWDKKITKWNAVFRRHVLEGTPQGKSQKPLVLTDDNRAVIAEMISLFPNYKKLLAKAKAAGAFDKADLEEAA